MQRTSLSPALFQQTGNRERLLFIAEKENPLYFGDERIRDAILKTQARLLILDPLNEDEGRNLYAALKTIYDKE